LQTAMRLEFVPVEEFYFALTLAVKTLDETIDAALVEKARSQLQEKLGQPSTVAPGKQNTFNYVFRVQDYDNSPASQLILSVSDWQDKLRLSSDYGWMLDQDRKPTRTLRFDQREAFAQVVRSHLKEHMGLAFERND